jgi:hypothetical protein
VRRLVAIAALAASCRSSTKAPELVDLPVDGFQVPVVITLPKSKHQPSEPRAHFVIPDTDYGVMVSKNIGGAEAQDLATWDAAAEDKEVLARNRVRSSRDASGWITVDRDPVLDRQFGGKHFTVQVYRRALDAFCTATVEEPHIERVIAICSTLRPAAK